MNKTVNLCVRITKDEMKKLKSLAKKWKCRRSDVVRHLLSLAKLVLVFLFFGCGVEVSQPEVVARDITTMLSEKGYLKNVESFDKQLVVEMEISEILKKEKIK